MTDTSLQDALTNAEPRPTATASSTEKKNYAERLSREVAQLVADELRASFAPIYPSADGSNQESRARTGKGVKKLDVNYSTPELGLGLGVSIKTINYRDRKSSRYTKNYTRVDNELRAEALDYHERQPYAVLAAIVLLPWDACEDGAGTATRPSSFGAAVRTLRYRAGRRRPSDDGQLFERLFVGLYRPDGEGRGQATFFDVEEAPPTKGPPHESKAHSFASCVAEIRATYDSRNHPEFDWDESTPET